MLFKPKKFCVIGDTGPLLLNTLTPRRWFDTISAADQHAVDVQLGAIALDRPAPTLHVVAIVQTRFSSDAPTPPPPSTRANWDRAACRALWTHMNHKQKGT